MFQLHVSIYVSIISINIKGIILLYNSKFVSGIGFTSVLGRIIIGLASWQMSIYTSLILTRENKQIKTNTDFKCNAQRRIHAKVCNTLYKQLYILQI